MSGKLKTSIRIEAEWVHLLKLGSFLECHNMKKKRCFDTIRKKSERVASSSAGTCTNVIKRRLEKKSLKSSPMNRDAHVAA